MKIANWVIVCRYGFCGDPSPKSLVNWQTSPRFARLFETEDEAESLAFLIATRDPDLIGTVKVLKREFAYDGRGN